VIGGTSAVAPLWAGLIARLNTLIGQPVGFIHPIIYKAKPSGLRDITIGDNDTSGGGGQFQAATGWDACTGLGSPNGRELLEVLKAAIDKSSAKTPMAGPTRRPEKLAVKPAKRRR